MTHPGRRVTYALLGVLPALPVAFLASTIPLLGLGAVIGLLGAVAATVVPYPCPEHTFRRIAVAVLIGICSVVPFGIGLLDEATSGGATSTDSGITSLMRIWLFWGPPVCGAHFLLYGRRT